MCGIVGFWIKSNRSERAPLGTVLLNMLNTLECRGPDSAGVALFGPPEPNGFIIRVKLGESGNLESRAEGLACLLDSRGFSAQQFSTVGSYARFVVDRAVNLGELNAAVDALDREVEVVSVGRSLEIVKQVGSPKNLDSTYGISNFRGTHGLGHSRLSTESRVNLSHSQAFWGHGYPDLAIVHNGHITNYHQLRRRYQQHGVRFYTENDSEVVAIYLAYQLNKGQSLEGSLRSMLRELDGSYSCLVATERQMGFVKDPFGLKPLLMAETDDFVALANEEIAIRTALPGDYLVREAQVKEVHVWER
jgi:methylamine---glutamate N-methyltransferase subunit A